MVSIYVLCALSVAYLVRVLLFDGSTQPFESKTEWVSDDDGLIDGPGMAKGELPVLACTPVGLMDRVRRVFGAYRVEDTGNGTRIWHTTVRMDLWRCPKCLSFWVSFLVSGPFTFFVVQDVVLFPVVHLAIAYTSQFLVFTQLYIEGD